MRTIRTLPYRVVTRRPSRLLHALHYMGHVLKRLLNVHPHPLRW